MGMGISLEMLLLNLNELWKKVDNIPYEWKFIINALMTEMLPWKMWFCCSLQLSNNPPHKYNGFTVKTLVMTLLFLFFRIPNEAFISHGQSVVQHMIENGGLVKFEKMWREHFINSMNPQHLPDLWSVEHHHDGLENVNSNIQEYITESYATNKRDTATGNS